MKYTRKKWKKYNNKTINKQRNKTFKNKKYERKNYTKKNRRGGKGWKRYLKSFFTSPQVTPQQVTPQQVTPPQVTDECEEEFKMKLPLNYFINLAESLKNIKSITEDQQITEENKKKTTKKYNSSYFNYNTKIKN